MKPIQILISNQKTSQYEAYRHKTCQTTKNTKIRYKKYQTKNISKHKKYQDTKHIHMKTYQTKNISK